MPTITCLRCSAREVSGDFYDVFTLPPSGTIVMVVGDVCDKGVGAALFMALFDGTGAPGAGAATRRRPRLRSCMSWRSVFAN
ncbi:MAG: hypothetical protein ABIQ41_11230 [Gemmatimonadales bacterium]